MPVSAPVQVPVPDQSIGRVPEVEPPLAPTAPVKPPPLLQRDLPARMSLRYAVQAGDGGFTAGQATYTWIAKDGHYSLVSIAEAKGIVSLFVSGRIIQTSEGNITPYGIQPEQYWMTKGDRRQPPVLFDWARKQLVLPSGGLELPDETQDLLSFPFHLAMTLQDNGTETRLPVTNGRKLREYEFHVVGHEPISMGDTRLDTLHLRGERAGEGSLDVWLAPARHWLPARIRTLDQKGKTTVLTLEHFD